MFITFEGPEGAGKTTVIALVAEALRAHEKQILVTREPGEGPLGAQIRQLLLHGGDMSPTTELFLFLADRANHVEQVIRPALKQGHIVLCDRYTDSTYVYQALVRGLDRSFVETANTFATGCLQPDATFLLDLPVEVGLGRIESKDRLDREPIEFHRSVRNGFLHVADSDPERYHVLDATRPPEDSVLAILTWIRQRLTR